MVVMMDVCCNTPFRKQVCATYHDISARALNTTGGGLHSATLTSRPVTNLVKGVGRFSMGPCPHLCSESVPKANRQLIWVSPAMAKPRREPRWQTCWHVRCHRACRKLSKSNHGWAPKPKLRSPRTNSTAQRPNKPKDTTKPTDKRTTT